MAKQNGNKINYNKATNTWTDTVGRTVSFTLSNLSVQTQTLNLPGVGGQPRNYQFVWKNLNQVLTTSAPLQYKGNFICPSPWTVLSPSLFLSVSPDRACSDASSNQGILFDPVVLSEIILPNNLKYTFTYNVYGEIDKVVLPTGGYQKYAYAQIPPLDADQVGSLYGQTNRGVVDQYISPTGQPADEQHWAYSVSAPPTATKYTVTATAPNNTRTERDLHTSAAAGTSFGLNELSYSGRAYEERTYTATNQMWRRTLTDWTQSSMILSFPLQTFASVRNPKVAKQIEILLDTGGNALAKATTMSYDSDLNLIETKNYDYASISPTAGQTDPIGSIPLGTLLRNDGSVFLVNDTTISQTTRDEYRARNLISLPSKTVVRDGAGIVVSATELKFDEPAYPLTTYSTVTSWVDPQTIRRGNATTVRRWQNFDYSGSIQTSWSDSAAWQTASSWTSGTWVETHSWYDQGGSVVKVRDANGKDTTTSYSDNFNGLPAQNAYAFPTSTTTPAPDSSGVYGSTTGLTASLKYDFTTGLVVEATDANGIKTTSEYNDSFNRPTKTIRANTTSVQNQTTVLYEDSARRITTTSDISSFAQVNGAMRSVVFYDGIGRTTRSAKYEGSNTWFVSDIVYDNLSRVQQTSNPYSITASLVSDIPGAADAASKEWTVNEYDALSRMTKVTTPDTSQVITAYSGAEVTVTDQAGKQRKSLTDGLGRLIRVNEAPNDTSYNYQTDYTYDALGNLIRVRQGGFFTSGGSSQVLQFRTFYYDSLSRLVFANNPEQEAPFGFTPPGQSPTTWTMKYEFDANGNLIKRTDPRSIATNYFYDALNRSYRVTYSDNTPEVKRYYDQAANGKGRLSKVESLNLHPFGQLANSRTIIDSYDPMGRVTSQKQGLQKTTDGSWLEYTLSRFYDLAGNVTKQTFPSGHSVNYEYNSGARLTRFYGDLSGATYNYAREIAYNAAGQLTKEAYEMNSTSGLVNIYHNTSYNNRFQMTESRLGTVGFDVNTWNRGKLVFYYGNQARTANNPFLNASDNNGNVTRVEHRAPLTVDDQAGTVSSFVIPMRDDYEYDPINRITSVTGQQQDSQGAITTIYRQGFLYDRFGNRKIDTTTPQSTYGNGINALLFDVNQTTNRIYGVRYDRAGNLSADKPIGANEYSYNAENRMIRAYNNGSSGYYVYDGDGRRVRRIANNVEYWYVYGVDGELIAEYPANGVQSTPQVEYGYRNGQMLIVGGCDGLRWLVSDHLGTPRMEVDASGSLGAMRRHDYLPFGEELLVGVGNGSLRTTGMGYTQDCVRQRFGSYERDNESGLDFAQARYFSSLHGRFTSADPLMASGRAWSPQSWNRYSYVLNRPLNLVDINGLEDEDPNDPQSGKKNDQQGKDEKSIKVGESKVNLPRLVSAESRPLKAVGGEVPVGGKFVVEYKYEINNPAGIQDANQDPKSYGSVEPVNDASTLRGQSSPINLTESEVRTKAKGDVMEVVRKDTFEVTKDAHSVINFQIVVRDPLTTTTDRLASASSDVNNREIIVDKNGKQTPGRTRPKSIFVDSKSRK